MFSWRALGVDVEFESAARPVVEVQVDASVTTGEGRPDGLVAERGVGVRTRLLDGRIPSVSADGYASINDCCVYTSVSTE